MCKEEFIHTMCFHLPLFALTLFRTKSKTASGECENFLWIKGFFLSQKWEKNFHHSFLMRYQNVYKKQVDGNIACDSEDWSNDLFSLVYRSSLSAQISSLCFLFFPFVWSSSLFPFRCMLSCLFSLSLLVFVPSLNLPLSPLSVSLNYLSTSGSFKLLLSSTCTDI